MHSATQDSISSTTSINGMVLVALWALRACAHPLSHQNPFSSALSGDGAEINDETFFRELPAALRTDMALELARPIFKHSDVFECLDEEAERLLAARLTPMIVLAGHNVAQEGDEADALFLLQEGARWEGCQGQEFLCYGGPA